MLRQVEQHCITITNLLTIIIRLPLSYSVAADAVTVFDFKQRDGWAFVIATRVEIFAVPPMNRSTEEKNSDKSLVAKQFMQVFLLLLLCCALRAKQEIVDDRV
jgi:hypothetical protein